jgi:ankyrin repeat protein
MEPRNSLSDRIIAKIKDNRVGAVLIVTGTILVALSTFSGAAGNLVRLLRGEGREAARVELNGLSIEYTRQAFVDAAKNGDVRVLKLFLAAGMDPNAKDDEGNTPLMYGIAEGRTDIVETLLRAKANVNERNPGGGTALDWAASRGKLDTVRLLLDKGADSQARNEALVSAAHSAHPEVIPALLQGGANVNEIGSRALLAAADTQSVSDQDTSDTLSILLDHGVDVNARDQDGWTALLLAVDKRRTAATQLLLDRGADVNAKCDCTGYSRGGWTALMLAARNGSTEIVKMLILKHANVHMKNNWGQTAIELAKQNRRSEIITLLRKAGPT